MRSRLAVPFAVALVCFAASPALAREAVLSGRVTHEDGAPVATPFGMNGRFVHSRVSYTF